MAVPTPAKPIERLEKKLSLQDLTLVEHEEKNHIEFLIDLL